VAVKQTILTSTYPVTGGTFDQILESIAKAAIKKKLVTLPSIDAVDRRFDFTWTGKAQKDGAVGVKWSNVAIDGKIIFVVPDWVADKPAPETIARWNEFVREMETHNAGHLNIFKSALDSLAQGLTSLRADDEKKLSTQSAALEAAIRERVQKRQEGYDRHAVQEHENPISKVKK
jgi:predicted secreted Zn-dependent protease